ncbi:MAG: glycosyl transferase family 2 [Candidatus Liptonbacteria bacterium RIFCSPLOWO2_01_FULL_56_20]|uniref:Glycosyl transferase family 2 n=1 Tax=Candidatus Liptonbacteria bacterium RIFCSPLOWO2_01_FULL_56_20 TaxID=1798652 RepID=A0A1G2CIS4_9BACT|nr:MAG: glycosyl transferase family 2 [Candidatus Liptonbacteria bacterium RIFCSPLOWO2_01_FULL_56_20]
MKLSFVIPAYNEEAYIGKCLGSIERELRGARYDAEVIVVNNASTDRTKTIAKGFAGVRIVDEPTKGIVWARRAGLRAAAGELIANIDADAVLPRGWLANVLREFEKNPALICLSGPHVYYDLSKSARFFVAVFYGLGFLFYLLNRFVLRIGSLVQGGNFVVKRWALERIGGYDTTINFYGEDTDIARRLHTIGPVKFTFGLPIYISGRRLAREGILRTGLRYAINFFWVTFRKRPFDTTSTDIRP